MENIEPMWSWVVAYMFVVVAGTTLVMGYRLSHAHPVAAGIGALLLTAAFVGWYMAVRHRDDRIKRRTIQGLIAVMLVVVFGGRYLVRYW